MESKQQLGLICAVLGHGEVLGIMAMSSMRSNELEHTAELPKMQEYDCGPHEGPDETDFVNGKDLVQALELLVQSSGASKHLAECRTRAMEELNVLMQKSMGRRPVAQQVA